jgi:TatD DNase family protein
MSNADEVARDAEAMGLALFATTVDPRGYLMLRPQMHARENVRVAMGLHPWWVADGRCGEEDASLAVRIAEEEPLVGEVGIDLSPRHVPEGSRSTQEEAFERICRTCSRQAARNESHGAGTGPTVLSIHSVRAATQVLDILEETGCLGRCRPVFHWFSGTGDELARAVRAGCWFSVNEMMLSTRRGREYARQVPEGRLLTETDLPPEQGKPFSAEKIAASLERTLGMLAQIHGRTEQELAAEVVENARRLFLA